MLKMLSQTVDIELHVGNLRCQSTGQGVKLSVGVLSRRRRGEISVVGGGFHELDDLEEFQRAVDRDHGSHFHGRETRSNRDEFLKLKC